MAHLYQETLANYDGNSLYGMLLIPFPPFLVTLCSYGKTYTTALLRVKENTHLPFYFTMGSQISMIHPSPAWGMLTVTVAVRR